MAMSPKLPKSCLTPFSDEALPSASHKAGRHHFFGFYRICIAFVSGPKTWIHRIYAARFDHESFAESCPLALLGNAFYPVLVHRLAVSLHASSPQSVTLMQLRFASFAVINSRKDFHLQECARAGRTKKKSLLAQALSNYRCYQPALLNADSYARCWNRSSQ